MKNYIKGGIDGVLNLTSTTVNTSVVNTTEVNTDLIWQITEIFRNVSNDEVDENELKLMCLEFDLNEKEINEVKTALGLKLSKDDRLQEIIKGFKNALLNGECIYFQVEYDNSEKYYFLVDDECGQIQQPFKFIKYKNGLLYEYYFEKCDECNYNEENAKSLKCSIDRAQQILIELAELVYEEELEKEKVLEFLNS